ncbi:MAG: hypothetical protein OQK67_06915 [Chlorobium sp.]|nr:hypothetical protein [Chlorobium sp.]MCW8814351.1 hypothetical protein [Chlorobium sp.]MCW8819925.1 hypothetical protein [Ignavibacteriaceae bacterium]
MNDTEHALEWTNQPMPDVLQELHPSQQRKVINYIDNLVSSKTDGLEELYHAIAMIVKYIPHFVVIPLMVEHIKPQIAAGVCIKMSVDQATGYANELPLEYFSKVSQHIENPLMAEILGKMKKHKAEKFIRYELQHLPAHMLDISRHLDKQKLEIVAKSVTLPSHDDDLVGHPHKEIIEQLRYMQG